MALGAVLADLLAELALAQELDELRAQEDADQQGGHAAEDDAAHSALPSEHARERRPAAAQRVGDALQADAP